MSGENREAAGAASGHEEAVTVVNGSSETSDVRGRGVDGVDEGRGVDEELEAQVLCHVAQIHQAIARTVEEVWRLGRALQAAKRQVRHGQWKPWLKRMRIHVRMAQRAMAIYNAYPELGRLSDFDSVQAAMRALQPVRTAANPDKRESVGTGETISVEPATKTSRAAQPPQESAGETGRPSPDALEPPSAEATTETSSAAQPVQESSCEAGRASATVGETSGAEATTETSRAAASAHESVDEQERGGIDADEESLVNAATTDGAVPAAAERAVARDDRTLQTASADLATLVAKLESLLEGTPARAASQRELDLQALSRLIRVLGAAIRRHLDRPAGSEQIGDLPDEFASVLHEVIETIDHRRRGPRSAFSAMRGWLGNG